MITTRHQKINLIIAISIEYLNAEAPPIRTEC